jgi:small subunit ribosomal protein S17
MEKKKVVKKFRGIVISKSSINTIKVRVETKKSHPLYGKIMKSHKNYLTDTLGFEGDINVGDEVTIKETRPVSKMKKFALVKKVK